jgi:hypothetical protein
VPALNEDEADSIWLEERVHRWRDGMKAAVDAMLEIARNWVDGRKVGRFYEGQTVTDFLRDYYGTIRLPPEERDRFIVKLIQSGVSARKAAKLTGVSHETAAASVRKSDSPRSPRKPPPPPVPSQAEKIAASVDDILDLGAKLPDVIRDWAASGPSADERLLVNDALKRLTARIDALKGLIW